MVISWGWSGETIPHYNHPLNLGHTHANIRSLRNLPWLKNEICFVEGSGHKILLFKI